MIGIIVGTVVHVTVKVVARTIVGFWMAGVACHATDLIQNKVANAKARRQAKKQVQVTMVVQDYIN